MADRIKTHDIWNDDDGEGESKGRPRRLRRALLFFLILAAVLGIVVLAAWRDGTGFDAIRRLVAYGSSAESRGYVYDASPANRFAALGSNVAVLSETALAVLTPEGEAAWSLSVQMKNPALAATGELAVAYDVGGGELHVLDAGGERFSMTLPENQPLIAATVNGAGYLAVTAEKPRCKGSVSVYAPSGGDPIFVFDSQDRFVMDAWVTESGKYLAAVTLGQENGVFISSVVVYSMETAGQVDPIGSYSIRDGLVLAIGQQGNRLVTVADSALTFAGGREETASAYGYSGAYLRGYDFHGEGFAALLLNRYQAGSAGRLVTVGPDGEEIASLDVDREVLGLSAAGRYLAVLYLDQLVIYTPELEVYADLSGIGSARDVLARPDGSAVLLSAESGRVFLP